MLYRYISIPVISIITLCLTAPYVLSEEHISLKEQIMELRQQMIDIQKQQNA